MWSPLSTLYENLQKWLQLNSFVFNTTHSALTSYFPSSKKFLVNYFHTMSNQFLRTRGIFQMAISNILEFFLITLASRECGTRTCCTSVVACSRLATCIIWSSHPSCFICESTEKAHSLSAHRRTLRMFMIDRAHRITPFSLHYSLDSLLAQIIHHKPTSFGFLLYILINIVLKFTTLKSCLICTVSKWEANVKRLLSTFSIFNQ